MIQIRNVKKAFGKNVVLNGIDLEIGTGEVVAVIGPSGTGKSTLLRCVNLLETPESGTISFDGFTMDYAHFTKQEKNQLRRKSSMLFQQFCLFQKKTALENVMEGLVTVQKLPKEQAREIAIRELEKVHMADRLGYYPRHLSGGQQQRVAIARALAMKPELLLLDEPTSALDPELVGEVLEAIQEIAAEGHTMLLVSHEMAFVRHVASKIIFMENGSVVEAGTAAQIFESPENPRTREFLLRNRVSFQPEYSI